MQFDLRTYAFEITTFLSLSDCFLKEIFYLECQLCFYEEPVPRRVYASGMTTRPHCQNPSVNSILHQATLSNLNAMENENQRKNSRLSTMNCNLKKGEYTYSTICCISIN